jgi:hypothetical protein
LTKWKNSMKTGKKCESFDNFTDLVLAYR